MVACAGAAYAAEIDAEPMDRFREAVAVNLTSVVALCRVNALAPGYFPTELTGGISDPVLQAQIKARSLLQRPGSIEELDGPLLMLASDAAGYLTGHTLVVDSGWSAW